ncbi:LemA family protein [Piscicoccus intestinalis]|uniref:LemA family protein n=1 Tax=Piscicoccus intestinalis TaxID=746033 RepID=UPI000839A259|nr:LemA family protein [Piscicoccus intestinalis]
MTALLIIVILLIVVVGVVVWGFSGYNGLIKSRNLVQESWRQIDVELKRRHDLIPNLVETVKGYASHESGTLEAVMKARSQAMSGGDSPAAASQTEGELSQALGRLLAVSEAYPDLKANSNFTALQQELSATEDRIASGRRYYNATVRELNTKVESVPTNFLANMAGISKEPYFEAEPAAQNVPQVNFGQGGGTVAGPGQGGQGYQGQTGQTGSIGGSQSQGQLPGYDANQGLGQNYQPSPIQDQRPEPQPGQARPTDPNAQG